MAQLTLRRKLGNLTGTAASFTEQTHWTASLFTFDLHGQRPPHRRLISKSSPHFEQAFSSDGGKTWEVNWITDQTRVNDASDKTR